MKIIQRAALIAILSLIATAVGHAQNQDTDSQTLKAILVELRAIHQDMQVTETTQLLVAELQMQQAVVSRATESADSARERLDNMHRNQQQLVSELAHLQDQADKATNADEKSALSRDIDRIKSNNDLLKTAEHDSATNLQDMQQRLRDAQDKLAGIEAELSAAISRLRARFEVGKHTWARTIHAFSFRHGGRPESKDLQLPLAINERVNS